MKRILPVMLGACFCYVPTLTLAADRMIEEIVVTATKREESIQDVPIAISAFTGEDLDARGITDVFSLQQVSPSLFINTSNSTTNGGTMRIRGIGTTGNNVGLEAAVGFFVDGVYRSRSGQALNDMLDIERIEVLRGPQGTLFGKNTSAGAVQILTIKPEMETSGYVSLTAGELGTLRTEGAFTTGLSDTLSFRIAGKYHERDGYYEDIDRNEAYNELDRYTIKTQLLWEPSDQFEARIIIDYTEKDESCCPATYSFLGPTVPALMALGGNPVISADGDVGVNDAPFEEVEEFGITILASWDLGFADLETVTGIREFEVERGQDVDFSNVDIYMLGNTTEEFDSWSQEIRLVGATDNLDWLVGVIYGEEDIESGGRFLELGSQGAQYLGIIITGSPDAFLPILDPGMGLAGTYDQDAEFWALFTHNTWHINDQLGLTIGLRYSEEDKKGATVINKTGVADTVGENWPCGSLPIPTFCQNAGYSLSRTDEETTGTIKLSYAFTGDITGYVSASRGYKSGGFNLDPTAYKLDGAGNVLADSREFDAEITDIYEIGLKTTLLDGSLTLNFAIWDGEIEDFQLNTFEGAFFTVNGVPEVETRGIEFEYNWYVNETVRFSGGITNIDTRYGSNAGTAIGKPGLDGARLTNAPEWQASTAMFIEGPVNDEWNYLLNLNWFHRGEHNTGSSLGPLKFQGAYNLVNAKFGFRSTDDKYEAVVWVNNAMDTEYKTVVFNSVSQAGSRSTFVGEPRIAGVTLKANF